MSGSLSAPLPIPARKPPRRSARTQPAAPVFAALGDPMRRTIYERLAARPQTVGELARHLPVSRPAVSQHLRALRLARLVDTAEVEGRRLYRPDAAGLKLLQAWLDLHRALCP